MGHNKGDDSPIYRYITFEKAILLSAHGFYVPPASAFDDASEGRLNFVPHYLEKEINEKVYRCCGEIESGCCFCGCSENSVAPIFGILAKSVYDFKQTHPCSLYCPATEKKLLETAEKICRADGQERSNLVREIFESLAKEDCRGALVSCWTKTEQESYALWKAYAGENGVRIKTTVKKFRDFVSEKEFHVTPTEGKNTKTITIPFQSHGAPVKYGDNPQSLSKRTETELLKESNQFELYKNLLFSKSRLYRAEEEYRFLLFSEAWEDLKKRGEITPNSGALFKCDAPKVFLEEIQISPFGSDLEKRCRKRILEKLFPGVSIQRSSLDML